MLLKRSLSLHSSSSMNATMATSRSRVNDSIVIRIDWKRSIWMNCRSAASVSLIHSISVVQRISWAILRPMPRSIRIVLFDYWWLFFDYLWMKNYCSAMVKNIMVNYTSVLAQLQLIAVQRKRFMSSMIRNRTPRTMASHKSQCGRIPVLSQSGAARTSDGSRTKTVVAASNKPSSVWPKARPPLTNDDGSPLHFSSSAHFPLHWMMSHWIWTSAPSGNLNIEEIIDVADWPSADGMNLDITPSIEHPRSSIKGKLKFFRLKAKQFFTLIPYVPLGWLTSAFSW